MKRALPILLIICLMPLLGNLVACLPDDPLPETLYTRGIAPGADDTYDIGTEDLPYGTGYFNNLFINDITTTRRILYSQTYWDDLRTPATAVRLSGIKPPVLTEYKGGLVLEFEDKNAPNEQQIFFIIQMPHSWKEGTDILPHMHWVPAANTGGLDRTVSWRLSYSWANENTEDFPAATTIDVTANINNQLDQHIHTDFTPISGAGKFLSSMLICSLTRLSDTDTFIGSAYFLEVDFHYEINSPGSETEFVK